MDFPGQKNGAGGAEISRENKACACETVWLAGGWAVHGDDQSANPLHFISLPTVIHSPKEQQQQLMHMWLSMRMQMSKQVLLHNSPTEPLAIEICMLCPVP